MSILNRKIGLFIVNNWFPHIYVYAIGIKRWFFLNEHEEQKFLRKIGAA